jgi:predicted Fe-Mo cluster-binding NifX family protein
MPRKHEMQQRQLTLRRNLEKEAMKIIITSEGTSLESQVDPRFGRAKHFVLVDTDSGAFSAHDNTQNLNAPQGAGIQAAQTVARLGTEAALTGHVGPKAFTTLEAANVAVYTGVSGTVKEAIEQFKNGRLTPAAKADVQGHWA